MIFTYEIIRSDRRSVAIQVDVECNIIVRAPLKMSDKEVEAFVKQKKEWLEKAVAEQMKKAKSVKTYSDEDIKILRKKAKQIIPQKVAYFSSIMGVIPTGVKINSARKRYGSCSSKNSLNFSLFLMDKDEKFIDYVVVHELAHIVHHNHGKAFYSLIEKYMPDYKERMKL